MRATARLFDADSHLFVFAATVLSCEPLAGGEYAVILDKTAFFPEGGGQDADRGTLGGVLVRDVQVSADGVICHTLPAPLSPGAVVRGEVDAAVFTHVSNVFGYALPMEQAAALCRRNGVPFLVDASQSAGVLSVPMDGWGAEFIAMPGHKGLYGPQGTGLLLSLIHI